MSSQYKGIPLPKFGEWDVNDPATAEGFSMVFSKARDEKRTARIAGVGGGPTEVVVPHRIFHDDDHNKYKHSSSKRKWFCCG